MEAQRKETKKEPRPIIGSAEFGRLYRSVFAACGLEKYCRGEYEERFYALLRFMRTEGSQLNVTSITDEGEIICKHFADCAAIAELIGGGASVIDVGTGGGFPALPLAILRPDITVTAIDSTAKKIRYVGQAAEELSLRNLTALCARAEELASVGAKTGESRRERFDHAVSRAVADLPVLCELCLPFVRTGGSFIAMKGPSAEEELGRSRGAIKALGGRLKEKRDTVLYLGEEAIKHTAVIIEKTGKTPENYPRNFSRINKKPL